MHKYFTIITVVIFLLSSSFAMAEEMSYSRISIGYVDTEEDAGVISVEGDGFGFSGSFEINENVFFTGTYASVEYDGVTILGQNLGANIDRDILQFGVGYHKPISDKTDIILELEREKNDLEALGASATVYNTGYGFSFRSKMNEQVELSVGVMHSSGDGDSDTGFSVGGNYYIREKLSLGATFSSVGDVDNMTFGVIMDY